MYACRPDIDITLVMSLQIISLSDRVFLDPESDLTNPWLAYSKYINVKIKLQFGLKYIVTVYNSYNLMSYA